ncbi:glycosyltransferase family 2 protein [Nocardioides pakistanensis]
MTTPDVTVVVAVYNTMPYLLRCLDSLLEQSIGHDRLEVVAVDDGSTDESGRVLDEYAEQHAGVIRVIHQPNSGGPAAPSNRALDVATGRYVFFLGSDDYLGPEALERMVAFADEHESDVVVGKMVGVNGRGVHQGLFADGNQVDVDVYGPKLRWAMANTKLFRRELIERLGLRYREDMPFGSDQPFTLAACVHARRISVLADYTCYYAVQREDRSNISYKTPYEDRVDNIHAMMQAVADLVPPGPHRDTLLTRHFAWEIPRLLRQDLLDSPESAQRAVCAGVRRMADLWLTDEMLDELPVSPRLRVSAARREDLDLLTELVRDGRTAPDVIHLAEGHALAVLPGFGRADLPERLFRMAPVGVSGRLGELARLGDVRVHDDELHVEVRLPVTGADAAAAFSGRLDPVGPGGPLGSAAQVSKAGRLGSAGPVGKAGPPAPSAVAVTPVQVTGDGLTLDIVVDLGAVASSGPGPWRLVLCGELDAGVFDVRLPAPAHEQTARFWHRGRPHEVRVGRVPKGRALAIEVGPLPTRDVARAALRRLRRSAG